MILHEDDYKTLGVGVNPHYLCINNRFNYNMYSFTAQHNKILDVMNHFPTYGGLFPRMIACESANLMKEDIIMSTIKELRELGLSVPDEWRSHQYDFLSGWCLLHSLCFVIEKETNTTYLATKNIEILNSMFRDGYIPKSDLEVAVPDYKDICTTTQEELDSNTLDVVAITYILGNRISVYEKKIVRPKSYDTCIMPYFMMRLMENYCTKLFDLSSVKITYIDGGKESYIFIMHNNSYFYDKDYIKPFFHMTDLYVYDVVNNAPRKINISDIINISMI